ncbi:MAG: helix-turn-helix transcriptional regulator [Thermoleophilia bacterium]|nr:helix-turn-helix transcriptional regulator [Thermoleophilia bacterium]
MSSPESKQSGGRQPDGYGQLCAVATALDVVGSRWTLLILRDLARTPLRFTDLEAINPTLFPAMLTQRLRSLEAAGIIERRTVHTPARTVLYALSKESRPVVLPVLTALADFGSHILERNPPAGNPAEALAGQMELNSRYLLARNSRLTGYFVFDLSGWVVHVTVEESGLTASAEAPRDCAPDATASFSPPTTLMRVMGGVQTATEAERNGVLTISGNRDLMLELLDLLSFAGPESSPKTPGEARPAAASSMAN